MDQELQDALNKGGGIALICELVECPNCNNDIWIDIGHSCGFDAVLEDRYTNDCYKCFNSFNLNVLKLRSKGHKFMAPYEYYNKIFLIV